MHCGGGAPRFVCGDVVDGQAMVGRKDDQAGRGKARLEPVLDQPDLHGNLLERVQRPARIADVAQSRPQLTFERRIGDGGINTFWITMDSGDSPRTAKRTIPSRLPGSRDRPRARRLGPRREIDVFREYLKPHCHLQSTHFGVSGVFTAVIPPRMRDFQEFTI